MENYQKKFRQRVKYHNELVNKYARKIGHLYEYHDVDKIQGALFKSYSLGCKVEEGLMEEEWKEYNRAVLKHLTSNPHHPEYFLNKKDRERLGDDSDYNIYVEDLDCSKMTNEAILEMCCDWCAEAEEFGFNPFFWMYDNIGVRYGEEGKGKKYLFDSEQIRLIDETLLRLWNND